jgi:hypothetical protein
MRLNINLDLDNIDNLFILNFLNEEININISQLYNLSTYLEQIRRIKNIHNYIINKDNILHAAVYSTDENNDYWIVLDKDYNFIDIRIPNDEYYKKYSENDKKYWLSNLTENEIKIVKLLMSK